MNDEKNYTEEEKEIIDLFGVEETKALDLVMDLCENESEFHTVRKHGVQYPPNLSSEEKIKLNNAIRVVGYLNGNRVHLSDEILDKITILLL